MGLANVDTKHGIIIQKCTGGSYKNSLTEVSQGWSYLGRYLKEDSKILYTGNKYMFGIS